MKFFDNEQFVLGFSACDNVCDNDCQGPTCDTCDNDTTGGGCDNIGCDTCDAVNY